MTENFGVPSAWLTILKQGKILLILSALRYCNVMANHAAVQSTMQTVATNFKYRWVTVNPNTDNSKCWTIRSPVEITLIQVGPA